MRTISLSKRSRNKLLHIEAPGCIINIQIGLNDRDGRAVTSVRVSADGNRYSGEPAWWVEGVEGQDGLGCRVIQDAPKAGPGDPDAHLIGTPWDMWRSNVAVLLGVTPADVSRYPDAYESFNTLMTEIDYCATIDWSGA